MRWRWIPMALAICAAPVVGQNASATLSGSVVAEAGGRRLPGAHVQVKVRAHGSDQVTTLETDEAGRFSFPVNAAAFDIEFDCTWGLMPLLMKINSVQIGEREQKTLPEIVLIFAPMCQLPLPAPTTIAMSPAEHAPRISGSVMKQDGAPFPAARVQLRSYSDLQHPSSVITGEDGRFEFSGIAPGKYTISTQAPGLYYQGYDVFVYPAFDVSI